MHIPETLERSAGKGELRYMDKLSPTISEKEKKTLFSVGPGAGRERRGGRDKSTYMQTREDKRKAKKEVRRISESAVAV